MQDEFTLDNDLGSVHDGLTSSMKENLKVSFNWMRVVSIISIVMIGVMILFYLFMFIRLSSIGVRGIGGAASGVVFMLLILGGEIALLVQLLGAGNAYKKFSETGDKALLELAFKKQKSFWLVTGILAIIGSVFFLIGMLSWVTLLNSGFMRF